MRRRRRMETTTVRKQKVVALKRPPPFTLKIPVSIVRILKCMEHWSWNVLTAVWHDCYKICPICDHQIPEERNYIKEGFLRCHDCGAITHKKAKTLETNFYSPSKEENEEEDLFFIPFKSMCIWLFLSLVFNKIFKTVSRVWIYCERLLVACFNWSFLRFLLFCAFIIISQSSKHESAARRQ